MRFLIATDDFPPLPGGVATWTHAVAGGLHAAGHEVTVLARARPGLGGHPYRVIGIRGPSFGRWGGLWTALAAPDPRRFHRVLATTWPVATALARWTTVPLLVVAHGSDVTTAPRDPRGQARVLDRARRFAVSGYLAGRLRAMGWPAEVLPPPVDVEAPRAPRSDPPTWGFAGRATPLKGGDRFVRLVAAAGVRGVIVGGGPALAEWRDLARRLGADVRFTGPLDRPGALTEMARWNLCFLLPRTRPDGSGAEGYGLVLAEAAARGVATVGCRTGGVPEAVGAGLVLDDPDDVPGSVEALARWWDPARGEACRRHLAGTGGVARVVARLEAPFVPLSRPTG